MKTLMMFLLFFLLSTSRVFAQAIQCPAAEEGLTFTGPKYKTEISGRSKATCRYYYKTHLKGTIEVFFYKDYERQRPCSSRVYQDADVRSWEYQAYAYVKDGDKKDFLTETYWEELALIMVEQAEAWALPCDAVGRRYIRQPAVINPEK